MCLTPKLVYTNRYVDIQTEPIKVWCGKCWQCLNARVNSYIGRGLAEASVSDWTVTLTLTYADRDDGADIYLDQLHAQNFIRSLRKRGHLIRYLIAGEYGKKKGRAHFHCVLFGQGLPPEIPQKEMCSIDAWPHGYVFADWNADEASLRYVCKYLLKDLGNNWMSQSLKPVLGTGWAVLKAHAMASAQVLPRTMEFMPPGGTPGKSYCMLGALERNFLSALYFMCPRLRDLEKTEWIENATKRLAKWEHNNRWNKMTGDEQAKALSFLDLRYISLDAAKRKNVDTMWHMSENFPLTGWGKEKKSHAERIKKTDTPGAATRNRRFHAGGGPAY